VDTGENVTGDEREGQRRAAAVQWAERIMTKIDWRVSEVDRSSGAASRRTHPLCRSGAERGTLIVKGTRNHWMPGLAERGRLEKAPTMGEMSSRMAHRDFAKRLERGKSNRRWKPSWRSDAMFVGLALKVNG
jgi:hypothetical protein